MTQANPSELPEIRLHCALELSKNSWLLAIQFPDRPQPSLYPIKGGDTEGLMAKLMAARERLLDEVRADESGTTKHQDLLRLGRTTRRRRGRN